MSDWVVVVDYSMRARGLNCEIETDLTICKSAPFQGGEHSYR